MELPYNFLHGTWNIFNFNMHLETGRWQSQTTSRINWRNQVVTAVAKVLLSLFI